MSYRKSETTVTQICKECQNEMNILVSLIDLDKDDSPWVPGVHFTSAVDKLNQQLIKEGWFLDEKEWLCNKHQL